MTNNKRCVEDLALFGGPLLFASSSPKVASNATEQFFSYARQAFEDRRLSNHGPLVLQLEEQLRTVHHTRHCITFANASLATAIALRVLADGRSGNVVLPAISYRELPHLIRWAGLLPKYCDVEPVGHTLSASALRDVIDADTVAVLPVDNVHAMCDVDGIEAVAKQDRIPVLLDSVNASGRRRGRKVFDARGTACVYSLNAPALINDFEGGYVTTDDDTLASNLRAAGNFGFQGERSATLLGMNAKLNEIHAALALVNMPNTDELQHKSAERLASCRAAFAGIDGIEIADYSAGPDNYGVILIKLLAEWPLSRARTQNLLNAEQALAGQHYTNLFEVCPDLGSADRSQFPVAERVGREFLQFPVGATTSDEDTYTLAALLKFIQQNAGLIRSRLDG